MPNGIAYLALAGWPVVMIILFSRFSVERAIIWSILGGYLWLPPIQAAFDFPVIPPLNKETLPNLTALMLCFVMLGRPVAFMPESKLGQVLMVFFIISPLGTVLTNPDPIVFAVGGLPGLKIYDSVAMVASQFLFILPFFLARQFLSTVEAQRDILIALVVAGLMYSVPMLLEVRLSPQLNTWIYGFFQHSFEQMMRQGGFRPIVFLYHGIWVAFFAMTTCIAAITLFRKEEPGKRMKFLAIFIYLSVVMVLCKTLAAQLYFILLVPLVLFFGQKLQLRVAVVFAIVAIAYPLLRGAELVPVQWLMEQARSVSEERAGSLLFRLVNESALLERASEKPVFGWGSWSRNFVFNYETGESTTVPDGRWIITIGVYGWVGYIVEFGLLTLPIFLVWANLGRVPRDKASPYVGALALLLGINLIDMLPNATLIPFTWVIAGALLGYGERLKQGDPAWASEEDEDAPPEEPEKQRPRTVM